MGAPAFEYEQLFKQHHVQVFSANFELYGDLSNRVMNILSNYSPDIEIYSIDECFLKLNGFSPYFNLLDYASNMRKKVLKWTGIPISIGIAPTKSLAKVANKIAKKFPDKTGGLYSIDTEEKKVKALKWLKIEDVWGIGRQYAKRLISQQIYTAYQFIQLNDHLVKQQFGITLLKLKHDLQGLPVLDLEEIKAKKNIATTRSFEDNYTEFEQLNERISTFAVVCAEKLRKQKSCCNALTVFILSNKHRKETSQYNRSIYIKLPFSTNSSIELSKFATHALKCIFKAGYLYKKAGVIVHDITPENEIKNSLFENRNEQHIPLMQVIDKINTNLGEPKIKLASQDLKRTWKMKQANLSPRYTTRLNEVITIHV
jgi:DNA polymerase V